MNNSLFSKLEQLVSPVLANLGYRLIERDFLNEGGRWVLRLFIDRDEGGVTIADCERASRALEDLIEVEEIIDRPYVLEVSSPGIDRPLRYEEDFRRFVGSEVKLKTSAPVEGRSHYRGTLEGIEGGLLRMLVDGQRYEIPLALLLRAHVIGKVDWKKTKKP
ncbi:MAG: ribosome maturation factor RimP [Deltaproteobacteria bacterium]|nr:ribosome maturation factor RimP [Deltaproteobacteria bacterium]